MTARESDDARSLTQLRRSLRRVGRGGVRFAETLAVPHGSLSLDDYVPGRGDVDLLVVVGDPEHAELTLLTTCRVWRFAEERRHRDPTRLIDASQVRSPLEPSRPVWV